MKNHSCHSLCTRLVCVLLLVCLLAPGAAGAAGAALKAPANLYDALELQGQTEIYVISEKEFVVLVQSPPPSGTQPVNESGLQVTVTTRAGYRTKAQTQTRETKNGMAVFQVEDFRTEAQRKATRYFYGEVTVADPGKTRPTWHDPEARLIAGQKLKVMLNQNIKEPYVHEASFDDNDVLMNDFKAQITPKNDAEHTLRVVISEGKTSVSKVDCTLKSGDKTLAALSSSSKSDGKFTLDFKGKWLHTSGFAVGQPVTLEYTVGGGTSKTVRLGVTAVQPPVEEPQSNMNKITNLGFSIKDGKLQITIPDAIPFVGSSTVEVKVPNAPITFYLDTTGKLLMGAVFSYSKEPFNEDEKKRDWKQTNAVKVDDWMNEQWDNFKKDRDKIKNNVTPIKGRLGSTPWMPKFKLNFSLGAMFKCENIFARKESNVTVGASMFVSMGATLSVRKYFFIAPIPVPFYIGADVKGSFTVARDFKIIINQGDPLKTMRQKGTDTPVDASDEFSLAASLGVSVTAGFGIDGIAGVWAEGGVTALPAITFATQSRPDKPYPHYEFKLNFYLKAGVRLIFVSYEMTPISYNYVIADNHDPEKKPYFKKISGPWMPAPSANDVSGGTVTEMAQAELESICIGSIDLDNSVYGDSWDGSDPSALGMQKVTLNADHLATLNGLVEQNLPPYQNDAIPYDDQQSDGAWTAGTSDGLGIVTPDYHVKVLENAYANPKIQYMEVGGIRYMFFIAAIWVDHVICPTLLCAELEYSTNKIDPNKLYAITYGTENKQNPRYVTDFDVSGAQLTEGEGSSKKTFNQFEVVVAYSKVLKQVDEDGDNLVEGEMGLFVRPFRWTGEAVGPQYMKQRKELKHGFTYDYKVKSLSILLAPAWSEESMKNYEFTYQVCVTYLLQYDYNYQSRLASTPTVMMYTRGYNGENWSSDDDAQVESLNYPVSQVFVGTGLGWHRKSYLDDWLGNSTWRIAYVYNEDRKTDSTDGNVILSYYYRTDFHTGSSSEYTGEKSTFKGYNVQRVLHDKIIFVGQDGMMYYSQAMDKDKAYCCNFTIPSEGDSFFEISGDRQFINFFYYWPESLKTPKDGTPAPVPTPQPDYKYLMGRMISMEVNNIDSYESELTGKYRTTQPFILCKLDQNVEQLSAYPVPGSYCGLYYTTVDAKKNAADIHFARVPIVDAIEVPSLTPSDPCIAQGEPFRMYINIENSGNTYLGRGTVELVYSKQDNTDTQRGTIDLLDCEKMMATPQEFDYSELGDDETYLVEEELTLAQAMKNADTAPYFDVSTFADASDAGYQADQVKLKTFVPGERHLYYMDGCVIPRDWTGTVKITGNGVGAERRPIWSSAYAQYDDSALVTLTAGDIAAGSKKLDDSLGGGYMAYTKGASALAGYSDVVLEGRLMRLNGTDYLELCLRNESTDPCDVKLQLYGDSTLLLEKTFHSVACGAVFNTDNATGLLLDSMTPYDNGAVTEGYDPATSTAKNGYINLTFPVAALTQGETFYKLTAKLAAADGFATLESDEGDGQDFILMQGGFLRLTAQPDDLTLMTGTLGSLYASFADGVAPYTVNWQKLDADGGWHDVSEQAVKSAAGMTQKSLWERLLTSAVAETGSIAVSLPFRAVTKADEGSYRVVVTDRTGQWVASDWAALTVTDLIVPPKTGDAFPIGLALALLGLSLAGAAALVIMRRRSMKTGGHS